MLFRSHLQVLEQVYDAVKAGAAAVCERQVGHCGIVWVPLEVAAAALPLRTGRRADGDHLAQGVYGLARSLGVGVGSKVARALLC